MLCAAMHLDAQCDRPFASLRVIVEGSVMLCAAMHLSAQCDGPFASLRVTRKGHPDRPFAALRACPERSEWGDKKGTSHLTTCTFCSSAQPPSGILDLCLRLMPIGADKSAMGTINRPLLFDYPHRQWVIHTPTVVFVYLYHCASSSF